MADPDYLLLITDQSMQPVGDPIACWTMIDVTLRFNEPGSGLFTAPGYEWIRNQLTPGCRVVVIRRGEVLTAGPVEKWIWERSDDGENAGDGKLTVNFSDFLSLIVSRRTYPDPTQNPEFQAIDSWTYTGNAEVGIRQLVSSQAGPTALTPRQIPNLVLGPIASVGSSITIAAERMEPLGDVIRRAAVAGGNLGFQAHLVGEEVQFSVYQPLDLSNQIVFGFGAGSLKYVAYEVTAPTANTAIVGGQGEGDDRYLIERTNAGSQTVWDRREVLVNRPGGDPAADLQAAGDDALTEGAETVRLPISTADSPGMQFMTDYPLGSKVSVETWPGSMVSDLVVTVHIQVYPTAGEIVSPTVGSQAAVSVPRWVQQTRKIDKRVSWLERNVMPAAPAP